MSWYRKLSSARWLAALTLSAALPLAWAQDTAPRPQDLEPGVNTSTMPDTPPRADIAKKAPGPGIPPQADIANKAPGLDTVPAQTAARTRAGASATPGASATASRPLSPARTGTSGRSPGDASRPTPASGKAHDRIELDTTQITGNRELPKVLYIVPWKRSDLGDLVGKPVNSLLDEVLAPVDRDVFRRENRYYDALKSSAQPANGAPQGTDAKP